MGEARERVLLVRLSSLGDVVLATAAVEALREDRPDLEVHVLTKPAFREVFANHPGVARLVEWDPASGFAALVRAIRSGGYRWVVDLHRNLRTGLLRLAVPGPRWSRYRKAIWRRRAAVWLRCPALLGGEHVVDRYLAALSPLGVSGRRRMPRVHPSPADRAAAEAALRERGWDGRARLVALAPGARWPTKAWPPSRWRELADALRRESRGFPVVVGGGEDRFLGDQLLAGAPGANLAGRTSILETAATLALCDVLVTNDSAPLHLATAVGTRVVALFGPTVRGFGFYPLGAGDAVLEQDHRCRPCSLHGTRGCRHQGICLRAIQAAEVLRAARPAEGPTGRVPRTGAVDG